MHKRFYYIDALRVIAILMMFVFHVSMIFVAEWDWHIKNSEVSSVLLEINYWMSSFRMPLLFFVSGFISYILMARMNWKEFLQQRFNRLIIPTVIWTFILVAPQIFFERKAEGSQQTYFEFYQTFLQFGNWWPEGNFHWLHLWFIPYLFCYNLLSLPVVRMLQKESRFVQKLEKCFQHPASLFVFVFIALIPFTLLYSYFPASYDLVNDIARHSFFGFFILAGLLFFRFKSILEILESKRRLYLGCAFISILVINIIRWNAWEPFQIWENWEEHLETYGFIALYGFNAWMWVLTCLGYGKKYLNRGSRLLAYSNTAVYPFYILHQTVIVIIGFYVVQTTDELILKWGFLIISCFGITVLIYHLFIRPNNFMRMLFGMKKSDDIISK